MDIVGLNELAIERGITRRRLVTMLRAAEAKYQRKFIIESPGKWFLNREAVKVLEARESRDVAEQVAQNTSDIQELRSDVDELRLRVA